MMIKKIAQVCAVAVLLVGGSAAAQVAGNVNVATSPITSAISAGSGVNLGTMTLTGTGGGGDVTAIPVTITGSNGGVAANLSNCQVYNNQGASLSSNSVVNTVAGVNTFTLNAPLTVNPGTGAVALTIRCDVASNVVSGSRFTINAGAPSFGPVFRVNLDTASSVPAGSQNVTLANVSLGSTGANYNVNAIPVTITASANGSSANLTGCVLRDASNLNGAISNAMAINNGNTTTFTLLSPMMIAAGSSQMFSISCSVSSAAAVGSSYAIAINPAQVSVTNANTGSAVTAVGVAPGGFGPNGLPASTSGSVVVTAVGTNPVPPATDTGSTPGVPNTGLGGSFALLAELVLAGMIALLGAFYIGRKQA